VTLTLLFSELGKKYAYKTSPEELSDLVSLTNADRTEVLSFADSKAESSSSQHMNIFKEKRSLAP
jgi:hypothetical protein